MKAVPFHPDLGWELRWGEGRKGAHLVVQVVQFFRNNAVSLCVLRWQNAWVSPAPPSRGQRVVGS